MRRRREPGSPAARGHSLPSPQPALPIPPTCKPVLQTAQEVSTMLRYGANPLILLINNGG